ncbi:MAG: AtzG-like protein [Gammaproteobacteria bacterium]
MTDRTKLEAYADAASAALGVPIPAVCREGVLVNLETLFLQAEALLALSLAPELEIAPVFLPQSVSEEPGTVGIDDVPVR